MTSNRLKADARKHMASHPGTSYQEALRTVDAPENHGQPRPEKQRSATLPPTVDEVFGGMVGLDDLRSQLSSILAVARLDAELASRGGHARPQGLNFAFAGPPGTGKTSAAYAVTTLLHTHGLIERDHVTMTYRPGLVGVVEGETARKTDKVLQEARGGVLCIDSAYELVQDRSPGVDTFGQEALSTILSFMDEHPDDLAVIFSGYEGALARIFAAHPELRSCIHHHVRFESFTPKQLWEIINTQTRREGLVVATQVRDSFTALTRRLCEGTDHRGERLIDLLGNARFTRNVQERAKGHMVRRLASTDLSSLTDEELMLLSAGDVLDAAREISAGLGLKLDGNFPAV